MEEASPPEHPHKLHEETLAPQCQHTEPEDSPSKDESLDTNENTDASKSPKPSGEAGVMGGDEVEEKEGEEKEAERLDGEGNGASVSEEVGHVSEEERLVETGVVVESTGADEGLKGGEAQSDDEEKEEQEQEGKVAVVQTEMLKEEDKEEEGETAQFGNEIIKEEEEAMRDTMDRDDFKEEKDEDEREEEEETRDTIDRDEFKEEEEEREEETTDKMDHDELKQDEEEEEREEEEEEARNQIVQDTLQQQQEEEEQEDAELMDTTQTEPAVDESLKEEQITQTDEEPTQMDEEDPSRAETQTETVPSESQDRDDMASNDDDDRNDDMTMHGDDVASLNDDVAGEGDDVAREREGEEEEEDDEPPPLPEKKKRGRPAKARKEEEDLCFICFDGGELVVCDRRGCPKVYHPSCVNRDESFFRSKGKWNCGWHICSNCEKPARYMCYTCTFSLCKGCIKGSEFLCVRGNSGFCPTCLPTVVQIEKFEQGDISSIEGVNFEDKNSWEYLFKDYWLDLKSKLSLTLDEILSSKSKKRTPLPTEKEVSDDRAGSDSSSPQKPKKRLKRSNSKPASSSSPTPKKTKKAQKDKNTLTVRRTQKKSGKHLNWASKELLDFVAHMRKGDRSQISQFDVQALLLEYIKKENLRDPRRKSQIVCDRMLTSLFNKARVGHFEMLKLLESHFLEASGTAETDENQGGVVDPDPDPSDPLESSDAEKPRRKSKGKGKMQGNLDDFAAIDVHNIGLMYLKRNLMEELVEGDLGIFEEKVIGAFVRIRISGTVQQRQDIYRLVQVVGTGKAAEKYKMGKKMTDLTLEILNLDKQEFITIDIISNQDFTEEECKRLRQSIKCGFIPRLTVGEVQEKARVLQAVKVNDWIESEKLRLAHLRDRASETGRRKELRECVEKLQMLNAPEEKMRRLREVAEIHADPTMDPDYESAEEQPPEPPDSDNKDVFKRRDSFDRKDSFDRRDSFERRDYERKDSFEKRDYERKDSFDRRDSYERKDSFERRDSFNSRRGGADVATSDNWRGGGSSTDSWRASSRRSPPLPSPTTPNSTKPISSLHPWSSEREKEKQKVKESQTQSQSQSQSQQSGADESEKVWKYLDPSGKIQGPFSMAQLRKWNGSGYFPPDLKIWKADEGQEDSVPLTDALAGRFRKEKKKVPESSSLGWKETGKGDIGGEVKVDLGSGNVGSGNSFPALGTSNVASGNSFPVLGTNSVGSGNSFPVLGTNNNVGSGNSFPTLGSNNVASGNSFPAPVAQTFASAEGVSQLLSSISQINTQQQQQQQQQAVAPIAAATSDLTNQSNAATSSMGALATQTATQVTTQAMSTNVAWAAAMAQQTMAQQMGSTGPMGWAPVSAQPNNTSTTTTNPWMNMNMNMAGPTNMNMANMNNMGWAPQFNMGMGNMTANPWAAQMQAWGGMMPGSVNPVNQFPGYWAAQSGNPIPNVGGSAVAGTQGSGSVNVSADSSSNNGNGNNNNNMWQQQQQQQQRVGICRFYESGHCKKGSGCNYYHPPNNNDNNDNNGNGNNNGSNNNNNSKW